MKLSQAIGRLFSTCLIRAPKWDYVTFICGRFKYHDSDSRTASLATVLEN